MISINILNYNTFENSCRCIDSCLKQTGGNYRILLIDNASTDDSFNQLKAKYGDSIDYFQTGDNYGYAGGNNKGVEYCYKKGVKYALLLNSDTELIGNKLFLELINVINSHKNCAVVSPTIYDITKRGPIKHTNDYLYNKLLRYIHILPKTRVISENVSQVSEAHGSALLVDCTCFMEVGGFPEHYFMYCEESTFAKKILWAGYEILWYKSDDSYINHHHDKAGKIDPWREFLMGRNRAIEYFENRSYHSFLWLFVYRLFQFKMCIEGMKSHNIHYYQGMRNGEMLMKNKSSQKYCYQEGIKILHDYPKT